VQCGLLESANGVQDCPPLPTDRFNNSKYFQYRGDYKCGAKRTECSSADHVIDTAGSSYNDVYTVGQSVQVLAYCSATDACLALGIHVVA